MVVTMSRYITVSTKIPRELKEEAEKQGIKISEFLRKALEKEATRRKLEELNRKVDKLSPVLEKININEIVKLIREDRDSR